MISDCGLLDTPRSGPAPSVHIPTVGPVVSPPARNQQAPRLSRRGFLGLIGGAAITAACSPISPVRTDADASASPADSPKPAPPPDWAGVRARLDGRLVLPADRDYDVARRLWDSRYDGLTPQAIAYCASVSDVQRCLGMARDAGITPRPRSGGHSYGGWSSGDGLIVDVTAMASVAVDPTGTAVIGAGARLIDVYAALAAHGRALPAGSCPTVGIAGLTLGGGVGVLGRSYGLTADRLQRVELVTADGTVHRADADTDDDLFWASRGGGGGNFGVATSFTVSTVPAPPLTTFSLSWPWAAAADVLAGWQQWAPPAPDEIWSTLLLAHPAKDPQAPVVRVGGVCVGSPQHAAALVDGLVRGVGSAPSARTSSTPNGILAAMLLKTGCSTLGVEACRLPTQGPHGVLERKPLIGASDYLTQPLSAAGIGVIVDFVNQRQADPAVGEGGAQFDAYGGAINRVPPADTAFVHRHALASVQRTSTFQPGDTPATIERGRRWLNEFTAALRPYVSGESYQNYVDPDLADWAQAYYGANLPRLRAIRAAADPDRLFSFPQAL
jgi:FAD/FMN-containing dehydrogenase